MEIDDKVSIIIPVYNAEDTIERCIDSILRQTYKNWELLIINDGSNDRTESIIKKNYCDSRIFIFNQKNQGAAQSRNRGLDLCKGNYITYIDADDWIENDYLEELIINIKMSNSDMVVSDIIRHDGAQNSIIGITDSCSILSTKNCCELIFKRRFPIGVWGKLFKTCFLRDNKISFSEYRFCEDLLFCFYCLQYNPIMYYCSFSKYHIVNTEQSVCNVYSEEHIKIYDALEEIKKIMLELKIFHELEDNYIAYYLCMVKNMVDYGIRFEKWRYTLRVVQRCPYKTSLFRTDHLIGKSYVNGKIFKINIYIYTLFFLAFHFIKRKVPN